MAGRRKGKNIRRRSSKPLHIKRRKTKKYRVSKWKLEYPDIFKEVNYFPYIIRIYYKKGEKVG